MVILEKMELRHLRYFVAVAEEENVSRAAQKLHVSQPGISRQIRDLEEEIGFQLFERSAKSVRLTAAGKVFLRESKEVLSRADNAVKKAREVANGAGGEIHVGYAPSLTVQILPAALRKFQQEFPQVRVTLHDLSSEEMLERLAARKLHVALTVKPSKNFLRQLAFAEIARYAMCVAVAPHHTMAKFKSVTLAQVSRESLIGYTRDGYPEYHNQVGKIFAAAGCKIRVAEEHESGTSLIAAVEAGRGVALVPSSMACVTGTRLKLISLRPAAAPIPVGGLYSKKPENELVKTFLNAALTGLAPQ